MKNLEMIQTLNQISTFLNNEDASNSPLMTKTGSRALRKNFNLLKEEYSIYEEMLNAILNKHKATISEGSFKAEKQTQLDNEITELASVEFKIDFVMISEDEFTDACKTVDMMRLDFMIKEE